MKVILKKLLVGLLAVICLATTACGKGGDKVQNGTQAGEPNKTDRVSTDAPVYDGVPLSNSLWQAPDYFDSPSDDRTEMGTRIKAIYYRTQYKNEETYAFAYLGVPDGATASKKAPAVLLLHGGGGSAYWEWVQKWNEKGYVALAVDLEGHVPTKTGTLNSPYNELYTRSEYPAPSNRNYDDSALPIEETWMYYAVQTAVLGNSLLRSLDYVDKTAVGVCGVSWGSVITSIVTGYDDRFAFSIPIYGTVGLAGKGGVIAGYYEKNPAALAWDDTEGLKRSQTPMLFLCSNADQFFPAKSVNDTALSCKNARLIIVKDFLHSQYHATAMPEPYAFADEIVTGKKTTIEFVEQPSANASSVEISVPQGNAAEKAYLVYTEDELTASPSWGKKNCTVNGTTVTYRIPDGAKHFYIQIEDALGRYASSMIADV